MLCNSLHFTLLVGNVIHEDTQLTLGSTEYNGLFLHLSTDETMGSVYLLYFFLFNMDKIQLSPYLQCSQ